MFQEIGGTEILVIAVVALIVVGPKDLPVLLRKFGQMMAKLRGMASEFRASLDEMARQSELDELRKEVEAMRRGQWMDPAATGEVSQAFNDIHQNLNEVGVDLNAPTHYQYADADVAAAAAEASAVQVPQTVKKPRARKAAATDAKSAAKTAAPVGKRTPAKTAAASGAKRTPAKRKPAAPKTESGS